MTELRFTLDGEELDGRRESLIQTDSEHFEYVDVPGDGEYVELKQDWVELGHFGDYGFEMMEQFEELNKSLPDEYRVAYRGQQDDFVIEVNVEDE